MHRKTVLLVEDGKVHQTVFREYFKERFPDVKLIVVGDFPGFILERHNADIAVMDMFLPSSNADTAGTVDRLSRSSELKLCFWTADDSAFDFFHPVFRKHEIEKLLGWIGEQLEPKESLAGARK